MRIRQLRLLLTPDDLTQFLLPHLQSDRITNLSLQSEEGVFRVRCHYRFGLLTLPVDLALRVAEVRPELLDLAVSIQAGIPLGPALLQEALVALVKKSGLDAVAVNKSHLLVRMDKLVRHLQTCFRLGSVAFTREGIAVDVADLMLPPSLLSQAPSAPLLSPRWPRRSGADAATAGHTT